MSIHFNFFTEKKRSLYSTKKKNPQKKIKLQTQFTLRLNFTKWKMFSSSYKKKRKEKCIMTNET